MVACGCACAIFILFFVRDNTPASEELCYILLLMCYESQFEQASPAVGEHVRPLVVLDGALLAEHKELQIRVGLLPTAHLLVDFRDEDVRLRLVLDTFVLGAVVQDALGEAAQCAVEAVL